ncbi:MAG: HIT domain-containing protein [Sedimentisphaerales bacterium]|nr:HIT domain-containing protein [Sedimentisphaerales bacterium]
MQNDNLWAPWRIGYLQSLEKEPPIPAKEMEEGCFLCRYWNDPAHDAENLVLWRTSRALVLMNRFPYTGGHLLIAPADHVADLHGLGPATLLEMILLARDAQTALTEAIAPQGFNLGINIRRCAGAGLPGHVHLHVVPRWDGDTNFMTTVSHVRVISQALEELFGQLAEISRKHNLPTVPE